MKNKIRKDRRFCAYCGESRTTVDHVPPKGIFGELSGSTAGHNINLITVPSCARCNNDESDGDAYFRDSLYILTTAKQGAVPSSVQGAVRRSMKHAGGRYSTPIRAMIDSAVQTWRPDPISNVIQPMYAIPLAWHRIKKTMTRIVRGLYWHHRGTAVPKDLEVMIIGDKERETYDTQRLSIFKEITESCLKGQRRKVVDKIFAYSVQFVAEDPRMAVFVMVFYNSEVFVALVSPPETSSTHGLA